MRSPLAGLCDFSDSAKREPFDTAMIQIGDEDYSTSRYPFCYGLYDYSWSEAIYQASEMGFDRAVLITGIAFNVAECLGAPYTAFSQKIYIHSTEESYWNYPPLYSKPLENNYSLVWEGELSWLSDGWHEFSLQQPYYYDGVGNISILWENHDGSGMIDYPYFYYSPANNMIKYQYSNDAFPIEQGFRNRYRSNIRIYYEELDEGQISGVVTDNTTSLPIKGARIASGLKSTFSLDDGSFSMDVLPGFHDVICSKAGYLNDTIHDVEVFPDENVELHFSLTEDAIPPSPLLASFREGSGGVVVDLDWGAPESAYEIIYDDGIFENMTAWLQAGSYNALRFTPQSYPCNLLRGSVHIGDGTFPSGGQSLGPFVMSVFDDDGPDGFPGLLMGSIVVHPNTYGWVLFDLSSLNISIDEGDFYLAMRQLGNYPDCVPIAVDESNPVMRSYSKYNDEAWAPAGYNDFMIRAVVSGPGGNTAFLNDTDAAYQEECRISAFSVFKYPPRISSGNRGQAIYKPLNDRAPPDALLNYKVYRMNQGDELFPDRWILLDSLVNDNHFIDNEWPELEDGSYRWAVEAVYSSGVSSPAYSNLLGKNWIAELDILISLSSGESPEGAQVSLINYDGLPEHSYYDVCGQSGMLNFPEVWYGTYDLRIDLFGYETFLLESVDITGDMQIQAELLEITYPPANLYVDSVSLLASWVAPGQDLMLLSENWESESFEENQWSFEPEQANWNIYPHNGNPEPCARFYWNPVQNDYSFSLISKMLNGTGLPAVYFQFDLYLSNYNNSSLEQMAVEVWDGNNWIRIDNFNNQSGNIPWNTYLYDISSYAAASDFKIRFVAYGTNTNSLNYWYLDNVQVYGVLAEEKRSIIGYNVFLDDAQAGFTTESQFQYNPELCTWGQSYASSVEAVYASGTSDRLFYEFTSAWLPPPRELMAEDAGHAALLNWLAPDTGQKSGYGSLVSYRLFRNHDCIDTVDAQQLQYLDTGLDNGWYTYNVSAVYDEPTAGESIQHENVLLYIGGEGSVNGIIYEYSVFPQTIAGAEVKFSSGNEEYYCYSDQNGHYAVDTLKEGLYVMEVSAGNYITEKIEGIEISSQQQLTINVSLHEIPYAPVDVTASPDDGHTAVNIAWKEASWFYELSFDDSLPDNVTAWAQGGNMNAVRFSPLAYPAKIINASVHIYDGSWPPGNILQPFSLAVFDDDGFDQMPGSLLAELAVQPVDTGWVNVDFSSKDIFIDEGDFYIVMIQGGDYPNCAPIAIDESQPVFRSYSRDINNNEQWKLSSFADFMMRAEIYGPGSDNTMKGTVSLPGEKEGDKLFFTPYLVPQDSSIQKNGSSTVAESDGGSPDRSLEFYYIYRLKRGDENNPELWTPLWNTSNTYYTDDDWAGLDKDWYLYAVKSVYTYNESEPSFSNALPKGYQHTVSINIRCNNGSKPAAAVVELINDNGNPDNVYSCLADDDGLAVFDHIVWEGTYLLKVNLANFEPYSLESLAVFADVQLSILLNEQCLPPELFAVDNMSGIASWLPPVPDTYIVFEEDFEGDSLPDGWQQEYIRNTLDWTVQAGSPAGIPSSAKKGLSNLSFYGSSAQTRLLSPEIDLKGLSLPRLQFWHAQAAIEAQDELKLYYRNHEQAVWNPLASYIDDLAGWVKRDLELPEPTSTYYIGFLGESGPIAGGGVCIDDLSISAALPPDDSRAVNGYHVYLDGSEYAYTTAHSITFTDLLPGQQYVAGIDADYGSCQSQAVEYPFVYYPCEYFDPPTDMQGSVEGMNVHLEWEGPQSVDPQEYQIIYDDNVPDNVIASGQSGAEIAVRYSPGGYPTDILGLQIHIYDGSWPSGNILNPMRLIVYDDDGPRGLPGTLLGMKDIIPQNYGWIEINLDELDIQIRDGDFYISYRQISDYPDCPPIALDQTSAAGRTYKRLPGEEWSPEYYFREAMIRAKVFGPVYGDQIISMKPAHPPARAKGDAFLSKKALIEIADTIAKPYAYYLMNDSSKRFMLQGFSLFKNGKKLNEDLIRADYYDEITSPGGIFTYSVAAVYNMGHSCYGEPFCQISTGSEFNAPRNFEGVIENGSDVVLNWQPPESRDIWPAIYPAGNTPRATDNALLLYKLWRNDEFYSFIAADDTSFTDTNLPSANYNYSLSALYDEGESFAAGPVEMLITPNGTIKGIIRDINSQMPIPQATISLSPGNIIAYSNDFGFFEFQNIPAADYHLVVQVDNYNQADLYNIVLQHNGLLHLDIDLYPDDAVKPLPFYENWDDASFQRQNWKLSPFANNWTIDEVAGNPLPSAEFKWEPRDYDYDYALKSMKINGQQASENLTLMFDVFLNDYSQSETEFLDVELWDGSQWNLIERFANNGDINWLHKEYDITSIALGKIFNIRFAARGTDTYNINFWQLDNIVVREIVMAEIYGLVSRSDGEMPLENAVITIEPYPAVFSDTNGYYELSLERGTYTLNCQAEGYYPQTINGIYISGSTQRNFSLEQYPCHPPHDVEANLVSAYDALIEWSPPEGVGTAEWLSYDDGINTDAIGIPGGGDFMLAIRYEAGQLSGYDGLMISRIKFFPSSQITDYTIRIWEGENAAELVYEQSVLTVISGQWNTIVMATPYIIDSRKELWIGYECRNQAPGESPAGCDSGPAIAGYGDMISLDGLQWASLTAYGPDHNWNIQAFVEGPADGFFQDSQFNDLSLPSENHKPPFIDSPETEAFQQRDLLGYNVYRNDSLINADYLVNTYYSDTDLLPGQTYAYYVTAVYSHCESVPSDTAFIQEVGSSGLFAPGPILYPNPVEDKLNIQMPFAFHHFEVRDYAGRLIIRQDVDNLFYCSLNISHLSDGLYTIRLYGRDSRLFVSSFIIHK